MIARYHEIYAVAAEKPRTEYTLGFEDGNYVFRRSATGKVDAVFTEALFIAHCKRLKELSKGK